MLAGIPTAPLWSRDWRGNIPWTSGRRAGGEAPTLGWRLRQNRNLVTPPWRHTFPYIWIRGKWQPGSVSFVQLLSHPAFSGWQYFSLTAKMADFMAWPFSADSPYPVRWFESSWNYSTRFFNRGSLKFNYFMIHFTKFSHHLSPSAFNLFHI